MLVTLGALQAQSNFTVAYSMGFGTGDLGSFISNASFRGATMEFRKMVNTDLDEKLTKLGNAFQAQAEDTSAKVYEMKRKMDDIIEENRILHILEDEPPQKNGLLRRIFK